MAEEEKKQNRKPNKNRHFIFISNEPTMNKFKHFCYYKLIFKLKISR